MNNFEKAMPALLIIASSILIAGIIEEKLYSFIVGTISFATVHSQLKKRELSEKIILLYSTLSFIFFYTSTFTIISLAIRLLS